KAGMLLRGRRTPLLGFLLLLWTSQAAAQQAAQRPRAADKPPQVESDASGAKKGLELNLLGQVDTAAGESRRNENVPFNLVDNNALKELNVRLGTTATIVSEFLPQRNWSSSEYGNNPPPLLHLPP